jgi:hypothetical protein
MFIRVPVSIRRVFPEIGFGLACVVASFQSGKHHVRAGARSIQRLATTTWRGGSKSSFLGMRTAQGKGPNQELAFVAVDWLEFQTGGALMARDVFQTEETDPSGRGG